MENFLILLVTAEQENVIQSVYNDQGWSLLNIGPHLSVSIKRKIFKIFSSTLKQANNLPNTGKIYEKRLDANRKDKTEHADITTSHENEKEQNLPRKKMQKSRTNLRSSESKKRLKEAKNENENDESKALKPKRKTTIDTHFVKKDISGVESYNEKDNQSKLNVEEKTNMETNKVETITPNNYEVDKGCKDSIIVGSKSQDRYNCNQCIYSTNYRSNYLRHSREVHISDRHPCSVCCKTFKSKHEANSHQIFAHVKSLQCDKCSKKFTSRGGLLNHSKQVHQKKVLYKCEVCDATFFYRQHYLGHMNRHSANRPYSCSQCSKAFVYKSSCSIHEKTCQKRKENKEKVITHTKNKVLCDICGEELSSKAVLKTHHRLVHSDEPKSKCLECGKSFKGVYSLRRHVNIAHTDAKNSSFPCEVCGKSFNQVQVLRQHVKRHKKEFSVYCPTCDKGFYSNFKLKEHERTHTGEKPFSCPLCPNFKCASKYNLTSHLKVHGVGSKDKEKKRNMSTKSKSKEKSQEENCSEEQGQGYFTAMSDNLHQGHFHEGQSEGNHPELSEKEPSKSDSDLNVYKYPGGQVISDNYSTAPQEHGRLVHHGVVGINNPTSVHYEHGQYNQNMDIHSTNIMGYESRIHGEGYYGNTSSAVAQGLNILTVAMNLVDHTPY